jgi:carbon-monoxide dehydrogenase medium subunit
MLLPRFQYHEPKNLREACELMAEFKGQSSPLAGGTDLLVNMKKKTIMPKNIISLGYLKELQGLNKEGKHWVLGAGIKVAELAAFPEIREKFRALALGADSLGSPLIRNLATIGGNLVSARPAADLPPGLMVQGARVVLLKQSGQRTMALEEFIRGPGQTALEPDEILTEIILDEPVPYSGSAYLKLGIRKALEISLVNVAAVLTLDKPEGLIRSARIVMGAVGPIPLRAPSAEKILIDAKPGEALFIKAGEAAAGDSKPIDDFRGSAAYRREIIKVFTRRALAMAWEDAKIKV